MRRHAGGAVAAAAAGARQALPANKSCQVLSPGNEMWTPAYVALGSNLDDPPVQVRAAARAIAAISGVAALQTSPLYLSAPLGGLAQPDYVNAVVGFLTTLSAGQLFEQLQGLEAKLGRIRMPGRWAPRRIDLDLLVYGEQKLVRERLTLPHPGIVSRNFVLYPLSDIAPTLEIPGLGPVNRLRAALGEQGLRRLT